MANNESPTRILPLDSGAAGSCHVTRHVRSCVRKAALLDGARQWAGRLGARAGRELKKGGGTGASRRLWPVLVRMLWDAIGFCVYTSDGGFRRVKGVERSSHAVISFEKWRRNWPPETETDGPTTRAQEEGDKHRRTPIKIRNPQKWTAQTHWRAFGGGDDVEWITPFPSLGFGPFRRYHSRKKAAHLNWAILVTSHYKEWKKPYIKHVLPPIWIHKGRVAEIDKRKFSHGTMNAAHETMSRQTTFLTIF